MTCLVTVTDDEGVTIQDSLSFVVENRTPTVSNVSIDISSPTSNDVVNCSASTGDPDGESVVESYTWQVNAAIVATGMSLDLSTIAILPTDTLTCVVTAEDAQGEMASDSADGTIQNSAPVLSSVGLIPVTPTAVDTLTCTALGSDPDGESLTPTLDFQHQGSSVFSTSDWTATLSPPQYGLLAGDTVSCVATLTDSYGGSVQLSDSVTLSSSAPVLSNLILSPGVAYTGTTVTCSATANDPNDGDLSSSIQYEWLVGALVVGKFRIRV